MQDRDGGYRLGLATSPRCGDAETKGAPRQGCAATLVRDWQPYIPCGQPEDETLCATLQQQH